MESARSAVVRSNAEVGTCGAAECCKCSQGENACVLCVAAELTRRNTVLHGRALQLEGALVTARAESVLLRRFLARAEELRSEDLVTLREIEEACARRGYAPDAGQPVALWIDAVITRERAPAGTSVDGRGEQFDESEQGQ